MGGFFSLFFCVLADEVVPNPLGSNRRRKQMMMPLAQGVLYNLAICGWQHWNRNARVHGSGIGARLRRWWYGVNGWALPPISESSSSRKVTSKVSPTWR